MQFHKPPNSTYCCVRQETLGLELAVSVDTVGRGLKELTKCGLLRCRRLGQGRPNEYHFLWSELLRPSLRTHPLDSADKRTHRNPGKRSQDVADTSVKTPPDQVPDSANSRSASEVDKNSKEGGSLLLLPEKTISSRAVVTAAPGAPPPPPPPSPPLVLQEAPRPESPPKRRQGFTLPPSGEKWSVAFARRRENERLKEERRRLMKATAGSVTRSGHRQESVGVTASPQGRSFWRAAPEIWLGKGGRMMLD